MDRVCLVALSFFALTAFRPLAADDVTGEWEVKMERNGRESFATLTITKKPDGSLSGKWGSAEVSDVKLDGQKLTFSRTMRFGDQETKLSFEGTLKDGGISGTLTSERGSTSANASRLKARNPVLGRWDLKYKVGDRDIEAVLALSEGAGGALDAKWTNNVGEHVVSNVKLDGQKLSLSRKSKFGEREIETTFEGTIDGHKLTGTIKSSLGEISVEGSRTGASLIGKWELTTTSDRGTRTSALTVFEDLTGRYELFGSEIPFKDLKLEAGQVSFSVPAGFGDQQFTLEFKGKIDGSSLKGEVTSPRGTRQVDGKKIEQAPSPPAKKDKVTL